VPAQTGAVLTGRLDATTTARRFDRRTALGFSLAVSVSTTTPLLWHAARPSTELLLAVFG